MLIHYFFQFSVSQLAKSCTVSTFVYSIIFPIDKLSGESGIICCVSPERGCHEYITDRDRLHVSHTKTIYVFCTKGIAVFFHSTYSLPIPISPPICTIVFKTSASTLRRVRFFVVGKRLFLTFYRSSAPPFSLEFSVFKNFKTGGNLNEN